MPLAYLRRPTIALLALLAALAARPAAAQLGRTIPGPSYFIAVEQLYSAEYRRATRSLQGELRGAVRTVTTRWIDSIAYHTMLGEALYLQGRHADALQQLDRAAELLLANAAWLQRVNFQQPPRPDAARARRQPAWARPERDAAYAAMPESFLVAIGQQVNEATIRQGGVVQPPQYWRLNAQEIARTVGWMIRRRGHLLGPLARHDRLQRAITDTVSRGGLAPANHWSNTWVELWWGLAAASTGDATGATPHLDRALALEGRYDHALTGLAALGRGELALAAGDPAAATLFTEAIYAGVAYEDLGVVSEALTGLLRAQAAQANAPALFDAAAAWSARRNFDHATITAGLAAVERALAARQTDSAAARLGRLFGRNREADAGPLGAAARRLQALAESQSGQTDAARATALRAINEQKALSLRNFQIGLATQRYDTGELSPRLAREAFGELLRDPDALDWATDPLDHLAALGADHRGAFDRWHAAAVSRRKADEAVDVAELARRRRWFAAQPLAGRLGSVRRLLTAADESLTDAQRIARDAVSETQPRLAAMRADAEAARAALAASPGPLGGGPPNAEHRNAADRVSDVARRSGRLLLPLCLSRMPTPLAFPPPVASVEARALLEKGQAVLAFHEARGEFFGTLQTSTGEHVWAIGKTRRVRTQVAALVRELAGAKPQQTWSYDDLASDAWRAPSRALADTLLAESRLDWPATEELIIVPDGVVWHVPFEALLVATTEGQARLITDLTPVRYAPTMGLALTPKGPRPPGMRRVIVGPPPGEDAPPDPVARGGATRAESPAPPLAVVKSLATQLVVDAPLAIAPGDPLGLALLPAGRRAPGELRAWAELPHPGPSVVALSQLRTAASRGLKSDRRAGRNTRPGDELFFAACALLAPGRPTALLTRWTTNGARGRELVAEWLVGVDEMPAAAAWRRSVRLAQPVPLEVSREPRVDPPDDEGLASPPDASHPFFWAGHLLLD